ncbi:MAG TPA: hypothetical protein VE978_23075 [Chitinophagales bacterium]|nr:hypothetical protein [Chitinophagales bacterium]
MGLTNLMFTVKKNRDSKKKKQVEFLIDSGAVYSLVPSPILKELGLKPYRRETFSLADGTSIERQAGDAYFEYKGSGAPAPVIFGEEGDETLLGVTTLEAIGLVYNPYTRELYPMRMLLV